MQEIPHGVVEARLAPADRRGVSEGGEMAIFVAN